MLYDNAIDEELAHMDQNVDIAQRVLEVGKIQVPLRELMRSCVTY